MILDAVIRNRGVRLAADAEGEIRRRIAQLDRYYDRIQSCRVAVSCPSSRHRRGGPYSLRIELAVPGSVLIVDRDRKDRLNEAIRAAFDAARRRLEDFARIQRGD